MAKDYVDLDAIQDVVDLDAIRGRPSALPQGLGAYAKGLA